MNIRTIIFYLFLSCSVSSYAQELKIRSIVLQPMNKEAMEHPCLDNNGDTCALLKIKTNFIEGLVFPNRNQYMKSTYSEGVYYIYVPALCRKLDLLHKDYMPIQIDMSDYGYKQLRKGKTYLVTIDAIKMKELQSMAVIKIVPPLGKLTFDSKAIEFSSTGTYDIPVSEGRHIYSVKAENYSTQDGTIMVGRSEVKTITVHLHPITHEVVVRSNVGKARVFVDNYDYGHIGRLFLPQGVHTIRVQANGYIDEEQTININESTKSIPFILKENKRTKHIHATPVVIFASKSKNVYKDNKKITEWFNGATIMFMPGKYDISDDNGNKQKLVVGSEPITIHL